MAPLPTLPMCPRFGGWHLNFPIGGLPPEKQEQVLKDFLHRPDKKEPEGHIISVTEFDEADVPLVALWHQIKRNLPEHMIDTPEKVRVLSRIRG